MTASTRRIVSLSIRRTLGDTHPPRAASFISKTEEVTGVKFLEAQVALARQWIGGNDDNAQKEVKIKVPKNTQEGQSLSENTESDILTVKFPDTVEEATAIIEKFEEGSREIRGDEEVADTVSQHMLQDKTSLFDEKWLGSEEEELNK